jgi:acyl-coenzyme A thioesterase PaaI-like protein
MVAATGLWDPGYQTGAALAALLTQEAMAVDGPPLLARATVDFLRPVRMAPFTVGTNVRHRGRNLLAIDAEIVIDGVLVVRASMLRTRDLTIFAAEPGAPPAPPATVLMQPQMDVGHMGGAIEGRLLAGGMGSGGSGAMWERFRSDLVDGEATACTARAVMLADYGSGISAPYDVRDTRFMNIDLSIHFDRRPNGEWLHLDAQTASAGNGIGRVDSILSDGAGAFARAHQTLFVDSRR